jgi:hypothetical protein
MTEISAVYWAGNVAHAQFVAVTSHTGPDPSAPVYGVDTPQRWPMPPRARRWFPRLPVRTDAERAVVSASTRARVDRALAEREAKRKTAMPRLCAVDGVILTHITQAPMCTERILSLQRGNSFSDDQPRFPYASTEAKRQLGIPDSPAIHLAITDLAERLLSLPYGHERPMNDARIAALRSASWGARESHCFELVALRYRASLGETLDQAECDRSSASDKPTDWLGYAVSRLIGEGFDASPAVRRQATRYGWTDTDE